MGAESGIISPCVRVSHAVSSEIAVMVTLEDTDAASHAVMGSVRTVSFACVAHIPSFRDVIILLQLIKDEKGTVHTCENDLSRRWIGQN